MAVEFVAILENKPMDVLLFEVEVKLYGAIFSPTIFLIDLCLAASYVSDFTINFACRGRGG